MRNTDLGKKVSTEYVASDLENYPEQYFVNMSGNITGNVALEIGSRSDRGEPYVRSKSSAGYTAWKKILTNADIARGFKSGISVPASGYTDTVVSHGLSGTPTSAIAALKVNTTNAANMANIQIQTFSIVADTITFRVHNNTNSVVTVNFYWSAYK